MSLYKCFPHLPFNYTIDRKVDVFLVTKNPRQFETICLVQFKVHETFFFLLRTARRYSLGVQ